MCRTPVTFFSLFGLLLLAKLIYASEDRPPIELIGLKNNELFAVGNGWGPFVHEYNETRCHTDTLTHAWNEDKSILTITFQNLTAPYSKVHNYAGVYCRIVLPLNVPEGWRYSIGRIDVTGRLGLNNQLAATIYQNLSIRVPPNREQRTAFVTAYWQTDFGDTENPFITNRLPRVVSPFNYTHIPRAPDGPYLSFCGPSSNPAHLWGYDYDYGVLDDFEIYLSGYKPYYDDKGNLRPDAPDFEPVGEFTVTKKEYYIDWLRC